MNEKFFSLPEEKRQAILNAAYRVFSQNSYKNSPMSEIAADAGISKSLLFHYFHNKKELYLYLWDYCAQITIEYMTQYGCYGQTELFESMEDGATKIFLNTRGEDQDEEATELIQLLHIADDMSVKRKKRFYEPLFLWKSPPRGLVTGLSER